MSEWEARIREHRVWAAMEALGPSLDKAVQLEDIDQAARAALGRLRAVLALCGKRLGGSDPLTVVPTTLDTLAHAFNNQQAQVDTYISDRNIAHLTDANANADAALLQLHQIPGIQTPEELIALVGAISKYRSEIDSAARTWSDTTRKAQAELAEIRSNFENFKTQTQTAIAELRNQLDNERQKITTQATEYQKAFSEAQEVRSSVFTETLRKTQESLNNTLTDQQGQFSAAQESRGAQFTATQADNQKRLSDLIGDYTKRLADQDAEFTKQRDAFVHQGTKQLSDLFTDYEGKAGLILDDVNKRREEVEKLVGVIGSLGVTSGYQKTANNAQKSMWLWQAISVVSMVALIFFAWKAFLPAVQGDFKWSSFAGRIFLTITVGVLAAYAVSQADRFFHLERHNRKLALELAAIDPFIALFPIEEQQKFKLEVGRRSFAQEEDERSSTDLKSPATTFDLLIKALTTEEGQQALRTLQSLLEAVPKVSKAGA